MKRSILLPLFLFCAFASASAQYKFTLIEFPGAHLTTVRGINNHGDLAGSYRIDPPWRHAMIYQNGAFSAFLPNAQPGWGYSEAFKINDRGDVAGFWSDNGYRGFLYRKGLFIDIVYPNASNTNIYGMNNSGSVVGSWDRYDPDGNLLEVHGFIWKNGAFTDFNFPTSGDTMVYGINNRDDVVGVYDAAITDPGGHGFVFTKGKFISFDFPGPDVTFTQANDISDNGVIIGTYLLADGSQHGMLVEGAKFSTLDYPGGQFTSLWGINSAGQIVGTTMIEGVRYGFLAQPANKKKPM